MKEIWVKSQIINICTIMQFVTDALLTGLGIQFLMMITFQELANTTVDVNTVNLCYLLIYCILLMLFVAHFLYGTFKYVFTDDSAAYNYKQCFRYLLIVYIMTNNVDILSSKILDETLNNIVLMGIAFLLFYAIRKILIKTLHSSNFETFNVVRHKLKYSWITFDEQETQEPTENWEKGTLCTVDENQHESADENHLWYDASIK